MVFTETSNILAILERLSPSRTMYIEIWLLRLVFSSTSAMLPKGPETGKRALFCTMVMAPPPVPARGSTFKGASKRGMFWVLKTASGLSACALLKIAFMKSMTPASEKENPAKKRPETKKTTNTLLSQRMLFEEFLKLFPGPLDRPKERFG